MMSPGKRWTGWAVLLLCALLAACSRTTLYSELDERQANEVLAALLASGVDAEKRTSVSKTGWEIRVDQSDFPYAMQILHSRGLPGQRFDLLGDIFKKDGFATSAQTERSMLQHGLQQEMSRTLSRYPGVAEAHVHINLPERDPLGGTATDASASVVIFEQPGANVRDFETEMKMVIKDGVPGMSDINKVTVTFQTFANPVQGPAARPGAVAMSAISPLGLGIAAAVVALLGALFAFGGRLRQRMQARKAETPPVWNG
ncbi:hypothetical protein [Luteimonas huabeiensis]|uniref:hypothetical protein n=1 Tax=Luteimonas huabeiensis TaxID=1244513 RepID=UPI0009DEC194|nr:hypothetical protein [Luteimonas huabeiensis]